MSYFFRFTISVPDITNIELKLFTLHMEDYANMSFTSIN